MQQIQGSGVPAPTPRWVPLLKQLKVYQAWLETEDVHAVAKKFHLSTTAVEAICRRIPQEAVSMCTVRKLRTIAVIEEIAHTVCQQIADKVADEHNPLTLAELLRIQNQMHGHMGRLLEVDTPQVQINDVTCEIAADDLLKMLKQAKESVQAGHASGSNGNGNRLLGV